MPIIEASKSLSSNHVDIKSYSLVASYCHSQHQINAQCSSLSASESPPRHQIDAQCSGISVSKSPSRHEVNAQGSSKTELTLSSNMSASVDNLNERTLSERADGNRWKSLDNIDNVVSSSVKRKGTALPGNDLKSYRLSQ